MTPCNLLLPDSGLPEAQIGWARSHYVSCILPSKFTSWEVFQPCDPMIGFSVRAKNELVRKTAPIYSLGLGILICWRVLSTNQYQKRRSTSKCGASLQLGKEMRPISGCTCPA